MEILFFLGTIGATIVICTFNSFEVGLGVQQVKFEPNFAYGNKNTRTKLSSDDLGLDNSKNILKPTFIFRNGDHRADIDYVTLDFNSSTTLTKDINFMDRAYVIGENISSEFAIEWFTWGYKYRLLGNDKSYLNLGIDLNKISFYTKLSTPYSIHSLSLSNSVSVGLAFDGNYAFTNRFGIEGKFASTKDDMVKDKYTYIGLNMDSFLLKNGKFKAGYQYKKLAFDIDEFDGDLRFKGPFVEFTYRF